MPPNQPSILTAVPASDNLHEYLRANSYRYTDKDGVEGDSLHSRPDGTHIYHEADGSLQSAFKRLPAEQGEGLSAGTWGRIDGASGTWEDTQTQKGERLTKYTLVANGLKFDWEDQPEGDGISKVFSTPVDGTGLTFLQELKKWII
jgi:hypothetical protein